MIALGVVLPASAHGATIEVRDTFGQEAVTYLAADGEENEVTMSLVRDGDSWRVTVGISARRTWARAARRRTRGGVYDGERPRVDVDLGDLATVRWVRAGRAGRQPVRGPGGRGRRRR